MPRHDAIAPDAGDATRDPVAFVVPGSGSSAPDMVLGLVRQRAPALLHGTWHRPATTRPPRLSSPFRPGRSRTARSRIATTFWQVATAMTRAYLSSARCGRCGARRDRNPIGCRAFGGAVARVRTAC